MEKRDGRIKIQAFINGNIQWDWMNKKQVSIPKVALKSLILTAVIDAHEEIEVLIMDVPNVFIQTDNPK